MDLVSAASVGEASGVRLPSLALGDPSGVASPVEKGASQGESSALARRLVLLVEDDRGVRNAVASILEEEGYSVALAENGRQALERLHSAPCPDLIILDLRMPVMDGWAFRAVQKNNPWLARIPVVAVSADRSAKAAAIDADAYLRKPLDRDVLLGVVSWVTGAAASRKGDRETFSLNRLVDAALATISDTVDRHARVRKLYGELHPVAGDAGALRRALVHVVLEVVQRLPSERAADNVVTFRTYMKGRAANIDIAAADCGGASPRFEAWASAERRDDRAAAALDVSRRIVEGQGGRIESCRGSGGATLLRVVLPLALARLGENTGGGLEKPAAPPARSKILVIDDVPELGRAIARGLVEHDVTAVTSAEAAFQLLAREPFDVIVCDVVMPAMGGREILERLERDWPHLVSKTIFMTGGAFAAEGRSFLQRISQRVLIKPFGLDDLQAAIREMQDRAGHD